MVDKNQNDGHGTFIKVRGKIADSEIKGNTLPEGMTLLDANDAEALQVKDNTQIPRPAPTSKDRAWYKTVFGWLAAVVGMVVAGSIIFWLGWS